MGCHYLAIQLNQKACADQELRASCVDRTTHLLHILNPVVRDEDCIRQLAMVSACLGSEFVTEPLMTALF